MTSPGELLRGVTWRSQEFVLGSLQSLMFYKSNSPKHRNEPIYKIVLFFGMAVNDKHEYFCYSFSYLDNVVIFIFLLF